MKRSSSTSQSDGKDRLMPAIAGTAAKSDPYRSLVWDGEIVNEDEENTLDSTSRPLTHLEFLPSPTSVPEVLPRSPSAAISNSVPKIPPKASRSAHVRREVPIIPPKSTKSTTASSEKAPVVPPRRRMSKIEQADAGRDLLRDSMKVDKLPLLGQALVAQLVRCENLPTRHNGQAPNAHVVARVVNSMKIRSRPISWRCVAKTSNPTVNVPRIFRELKRPFSPVSHSNKKETASRASSHSVLKKKKRMGWRNRDGEPTKRTIEGSDGVTQGSDLFLVKSGDRLVFEVYDRVKSAEDRVLIASGSLDLSRVSHESSIPIKVSLVYRRRSDSDDDDDDDCSDDDDDMERDPESASRRRRRRHRYVADTGFGALHRKYAPFKSWIKPETTPRRRRESILTSPRLFVRFLAIPPPSSKTIFFVRHAQSKWNHGQKHWNPFAMLTHVDHGLSREGEEQALHLWDDIVSMPAKIGDLVASGRANVNQLDSWRRFLDTPLIVSSPFMRAVQTAMVALRGHPAIRKRGITLFSSVREIKRSVGSFDCIGVSSGKSSIHYRAIESLSWANDEAVEDEDSRRSGPRQGNEETLISNLRSIDITTGDCSSGEWWTKASDHEKEEDVLSRMRDFVLRLRFMPESTAIVVSHSNFLLTFLKHFASAKLRKRCPPDYFDLTASKVENCGVVQIDFDFPSYNCSTYETSAKTTAMGLCNVADVKLLFGTRVEKHRTTSKDSDGGAL